jgi:signal transduction histidine kinase
MNPLLPLPLGIWVCLLASFTDIAKSVEFTNLAALRPALVDQGRIGCGFQLTGVVCDVNPSSRMVVLQAGPVAEVLRIERGCAGLQCGQQLRLEGADCELVWRKYFLEIRRRPAVDNDGLHGTVERVGSLHLEVGRNPIRLVWFNRNEAGVLNVTYSGPGISRQPVAANRLFHGDAPGLSCRSFEGIWNHVNDFDLSASITNWISPTLEIGRVAGRELVGLEFSGDLSVDTAGDYTFWVDSDDGSLLFLGELMPRVRCMGMDKVPKPFDAGSTPGVVGQAGQWAEVSGTVVFVSKREEGIELDLENGRQRSHALIVNDEYLPAIAPGSQLRLRGVLLPTHDATTKGATSLLIVVSHHGVELQPDQPAQWTPTATNSPPLLTTVERVRNLSAVEAARGYPVKMRGVVIDDDALILNGFFLHDGTDGIYVSYQDTPLVGRPSYGEIWEIAGKTGPGQFVPIVTASQMQRLGVGNMPEPDHPTWDQLLSGSLDVNYAEVQGVVLAEHGLSLDLLMHGGKIQFALSGRPESDLKQYLGALVKIRGTLHAFWDYQSHQVQVGVLRFSYPLITTVQPAPQDLFSAPLKSAADLLRFDPMAASLRRVRVRGQMLAQDKGQYFILNGQSGLRVEPQEAASLVPGDTIEAVGFPDLSGSSPRIKEAVVRKSGHAPLPAAGLLDPEHLFKQGLDATRAKVVGDLLGVHSEMRDTVLELQSGPAKILGRYTGLDRRLALLKAGSRLEMTGTYDVIEGTMRDGQAGAFELLLNAPDDVRVLSRPPWLTPRRMLWVVGVFIAALLTAGLWIAVLQQQIRQRTRQLRREIYEREHAEQQRLIQEERTRIAQDLHDDLGSTLTEISVLASRGGGEVDPSIGSHGLFQAIGERARQLVASLDAIVWAIDLSSNTMQSLIDYLAGYAGDYLSNAQIACRFKIPVEFPRSAMEGRIRHELYLVFKEALHNIVAHAGATEVELQIQASETALEINIRDNGRGFDPAASRSGHGVKNYHERMARLGGICQVTSRPGAGTAVAFKIPIDDLKGPPRAGDPE